MAKRLAASTRESDTVARLGGDEFVVVGKDLGSVLEADLLGERLMSAFGDPFAVGPHEFRVTTSIGRAMFPLDADDSKTLLREADVSMFQAKRKAVAAR